MLTIRLMRFGKKHQPFFRLVVVPKRGKPARSKYVELLGWVNPFKHERKIDAERVRYWISQGAQPSPTAWNIFVAEGVISGEKKRKKGKVVILEPEPQPATSQATTQASEPIEETPPALEASGGGETLAEVVQEPEATKEPAEAPAGAGAGEVDNKD